jgi:hypothetical protein
MINWTNYKASPVTEDQLEWLKGHMAPFIAKQKGVLNVHVSNSPIAFAAFFRVAITLKSNETLICLIKQSLYNEARGLTKTTSPATI